MYLRADHAEPDAGVLQELIHANPLGLFITALASPNFPTIQCTHLPWLLDVDKDEDGRSLGRLRGHMARANPHAKAIIEAAQQAESSDRSLEHEASVIFNAPVHAYISPKFYVDVKPQTGKVVPTWNYAAAQVYGKVKVYHDARSEETQTYLQRQIVDLTNYSERTVMESMGGDTSSTWEVDDAPRPYIDIMRKNIIGIEIHIERLEGKFKMSQERTPGDRAGVIQGFQAFDTDHGRDIARIVEERGKLRDAKAAAAKS